MSAATQLQLKFEKPKTKVIKQSLPLTVSHVVDADAIDDVLLDMLFSKAEKEIKGEQVK